MCGWCVAVLVFILYLYNAEPFSPFYNDLFSNVALIGAAVVCAICATRVFQRYEPTDSPRVIWRQFAIGLWLWSIAELIWSFYNMAYGEVGITIADFFWVLAYAFFAHAIYVQYQVLFRLEKRDGAFWMVVWLGGVSVLVLLTAFLLVKFVDGQWGLPLMIASFYPVADFAIGYAALRIVRRFRGGALGYPWLGLFIFAVADAIYAILDVTGLYTWSISTGNWWSMVADVVYNAAYLFVALGCFVQLLLLKYGSIFINTRKDLK
jgi:hypothetical protein